MQLKQYCCEIIFLFTAYGTSSSVYRNGFLLRVKATAGPQPSTNRLYHAGSLAKPKG